MKTVAVLVPIYRELLSDLEAISLRQIHYILHDYDIIYIEPENIEYDDNHGIVRRFPSACFASILTYNRLLLNQDFYKAFLDYKYILVCQLDVFVFSNRLKAFCDMGYDYYGAPWLNGVLLNAGKGLRLRFSGNGGLSLRNVHKTLKLLERYGDYAEAYEGNEDFFFSYFSSNEYRVAPSDVSRRFCIETHVRRCMHMNKGELPFGTHAWERYDFEFWKPYIEEYGYDLSSVNMMNGNEDKIIKKGILRVALANILRSISDYRYRRNI